MTATEMQSPPPPPPPAHHCVGTGKTVRVVSKRKKPTHNIASLALLRVRVGARLTGQLDHEDHRIGHRGRALPQPKAGRENKGQQTGGLCSGKCMRTHDALALRHGPNAGPHQSAVACTAMYSAMCMGTDRAGGFAHVLPDLCTVIRTVPRTVISAPQRRSPAPPLEGQQGAQRAEGRCERNLPLQREGTGVGPHSRPRKVAVGK